MRSLATLTLVIFSIALPAAAQQPPFGERVDVEAVLLDVVVTDNEGNQILGLDKDDFVVRENGVVQTIDSVDYFTTRRLINDREENLPFDVERVKEERYLVFFFDKPEGGTFFSEIARARAAANRFIDEQMGSGDMVAIVGHDVRLKVYSDFTSNKQQLKRALREVALFSRGEAKSDAAQQGPSILRNLTGGEMMNDTGTVYEAITVLADALRPIRGRKNLVVFSAGIIEHGETIRGGVLLNESRYYQPMIDALHAANVTVYAASLLPVEVTDSAFHQTLGRMADETNGEYFRHSISYEPVLRQVDKATAGYYLITYRTNRRRGDRGFQKVDVSVDAPGLRVKARPGYVYGSN